MFAFDLSRIRRAVRHRVAESHEMRELSMELSLRAQSGLVWQALTESESIAQWYSRLHGTLRAGGTYRIEGLAAGNILSCEPCQRLVVTWDVPDHRSRLEFLLRTASTHHCVLTLLVRLHVPDLAWDAFGPGTFGFWWDRTLARLASHVESGVIVEGFPDPRQSASGRAFVASSSNNWEVASVAAGTDAAAAAAAASRTVQAFLADSCDLPSDS